MRRIRKQAAALGILLVSLLALCVLVYQLPPVKDRLFWRFDGLRAQVKYALSPPERSIFIPKQIAATSTPAPLSSLTLSPALRETTEPPVATGEATSTLEPTDTPTLTPSPIPGTVQLSGVTHEYQGWNNCGPATLAMALSFWDWQGNQNDIAPLTKPNPRDKNVMPYELAEYVESNTTYKVIVRTGGEIGLLKRFLAASLPVIVEKGFEGPDFDGWMGHYVLTTGYNDPDQLFTLQDSYYGPDQVIAYEDLERFWRAFNFTYLVVFPAEREREVLEILGPQADKTFNDQFAAQKASDEIYALSGRDQYFAWFNRGTSLVALQDYNGAAAAFDQAFTLHPSIPEKERPWRMMWYQTGPYWAYYYTGRYQDVIDLATTTLDNMSEPVLEESFYWRGLAREALGDIPGAIEDFRAGLKAHPGFRPALERLRHSGIESE